MKSYNIFENQYLRVQNPLFFPNLVSRNIWKILIVRCIKRFRGHRIYARVYQIIQPQRQKYLTVHFYLRLEKFDIPLYFPENGVSLSICAPSAATHLMWVCKQPSCTLQLKPSLSVSFCRNRYFHLNSFISCLPNTGALFTTTLGAQNDSTNDSNAGGHGQESCVFSALLTQSAADVWGSNPGPPLCQPNTQTKYETTSGMSLPPASDSI